MPFLIECLCQFRQGLHFAAVKKKSCCSAKVDDDFGWLQIFRKKLSTLFAFQIALASPAVQVVLEGASSIPAAAAVDCFPPPTRAGADGPPFTFWFPITLFGLNRDTFRIRCCWTMCLSLIGGAETRSAPRRAAARWTLLQGSRK